MAQKYTVYGNDDFDTKIDSDMKLVKDTMLSKLPKKDIAAIILGGGYGRGEGGVVLNGETMSLYNDYDMFMVTEDISKNKMSEYQKIIFEASEELQKIIGVDVDFGPLKNKSELSCMPFTLMYYELKKGHKVIFGDENILQNLPENDINDIPHEETLNYMLNRGVGLFLAGQKIKKKDNSDNDLEFIERNIYKALMACGDIFLILNKKYSYSYVNRGKFIDDFKENSMIKEKEFINYYKDSINYKLKPKNNFDLLDAKFEYAIDIFKKFYLYVFSEYWNVDISSFEEYYSLLSKNGIATCRGFSNLPKNIALNLKEIGIHNISLKNFMNYPRYRLFFILPNILLDIKVDDAILNKSLGVCKSLSDDEKYKRFMTLWNRFN